VSSMSTTRPPLRGSTGPVYVELNVFKADDGWMWLARIWLGDVDVLEVEPTLRRESKRAYATRYGAWSNAVRQLERLA